MNILKAQQWLQPQKVLPSNKVILRSVSPSVPKALLETPDEKSFAEIQKAFLHLKFSNTEHRCAYCNKPMLSQRTLAFIVENAPNSNGSGLLEILNANIGLLGKTSKKIVSYIQKFCKKMPNGNFWDIFNSATNNLIILQGLKEKSFSISNLRYSEKRALQKFFTSSQRLIFSQNRDNPSFIPEIFLAKFNEILNSFRHQNEFDNLREYANSLPDLSTDINIFFNKNNHKKNSKSIFNHIFLNSLETEEHLGEQVHYPTDKNNPFNLILTCFKCNNQRDSLPFKDFIDSHHNVILILKSYVKQLLYSENADIRAYATGVAKNIEKLSAGKVSFFDKNASNL